MNKITFNQYQIMHHTTDWGGNRNLFGTDAECRDAKDFYKLIEMGLASSNPAPSWSGDDIVFYVTDEGKDLLKSLTSKQKVKMYFEHISQSQHAKDRSLTVWVLRAYLRITYSKARHALLALVKDGVLLRDGNQYKLAPNKLGAVA